MKTYSSSLIIFLVIICLYYGCTKVKDAETKNPALFITLKDDSAKAVSGARVRLYKSNIDSSLIKISDSTGVVIFTDLDVANYNWIAEKGCLTNRVSQTTLNRNLIPDVILYGYSVMTKTGAIKIINNAAEDYKVSDSLTTITIKKDSSFFAYRRVHSYLIHSEKLSTPGTGKDTLINIKCGDTSILRLPY
jgi:hypothetical protein